MCNDEWSIKIYQTNPSQYKNSTYDYVRSRSMAVKQPIWKDQVYFCLTHDGKRRNSFAFMLIVLLCKRFGFFRFGWPEYRVGCQIGGWGRGGGIYPVKNFHWFYSKFVSSTSINSKGWNCGSNCNSIIIIIFFFCSCCWT